MENPKNYLSLVRLLKKNGFIMCSKTKKHEKYSNGLVTITMPKRHSKGFSEILAKKILKQAQID